jgi:hypothetical protein
MMCPSPRHHVPPRSCHPALGLGLNGHHLHPSALSVAVGETVIRLRSADTPPACPPAGSPLCVRARVRACVLHVPPPCIQHDFTRLGPHRLGTELRRLGYTSPRVRALLEQLWLDAGTEAAPSLAPPCGQAGPPSAVPLGGLSPLFAPKWWGAAQPLFSPPMGVEHMAPLLYRLRHISMAAGIMN